MASHPEQKEHHRVVVASSDSIMGPPPVVDEELMFVRQISVENLQGLPSTGVMAVFVQNGETLVLQILAEEPRGVTVTTNANSDNDNERRGGGGASVVYHASFDSTAASQSLSKKGSSSSESSTPLETLASLLDDSTQQQQKNNHNSNHHDHHHHINDSSNNRTGRYQWSCRHEGSNLDVLIHEQLSNDLVLNRWKCKIPPSPSCKVLSFTLSLMQAIHQRDTEADQLKTKMDDVAFDRDDCLAKVNALSGKWEQEKSELIQSFLQLYNESQAVPDDRGQGQAKEARSERIQRHKPETADKRKRNASAWHSSESDVASLPRRRGRQNTPVERGRPKKRRREVTGDNISSSDESEQDMDAEVEVEAKNHEMKSDDTSTGTSGSHNLVATNVSKTKSTMPVANDSGSETDDDF